MITREEARNKLIKSIFKEDQGNFFKELYERFKCSWNKIGFDSKIQFECKQLDYIKYNDESELINFLIDNKEPGNGMCMAAGL